jgi:hypothetical protein
MSTHLILPDSHSHPDHPNDRADWVGKLIVDLKPDVFVNMGDQWDLSSLSGYDKGKASFQGRAYRRDLDAGKEYSERLFAPIRKAKKKRPLSIFIEGNHEERQRRLLEYHPELEGTIGFNDFELEKDYDDVIRYKGNTPGSVEVDGITYAHYFLAGISGRPLGGEHAAYTLLTKNFKSCTAAHSHTFDYCVRTDGNGRRIHGLVAGVYQDYNSEWAGELNKLWSRGVVIKRNVNNGDYDLEWVSLDRLKKEYG